LNISSVSSPTLWSGVTSTSAFLSPELLDDYAGAPIDQVYDLVLTRLSFTTGALGSNAGLAAALDDMYDGPDGGDMRDILDALIVMSPGEAQTALAELGGGTHTAFQFMSFYGLDKYHWALNNHLGGGWFAGGAGKGMAANQYAYPQGLQTAMAAGGNTLSDAAPMLLALAGNGGQLASGINWDLWIDGYLSQGNRSSDDLISSYKQTLYGALMGFDYRATDKLLIGISLGLSQTEVKFDNLLDKGDQDSYQGSLYAHYDAKPWYVEGILTYAYNNYKMDRWITTGGTWLANSEYKGNEFAGYAEVGYKLDVGGVVISPMAALQATYLMQDGFTETGAGDLNLIVDSQDTGSYQSYLGVHISKAIAMGNFVLTPDVRAKWAHEFSPDDHMINARFSGSGSGSFTVEADRPSRDTAIVGMGLNGRFNKNLSMYIQYDADINKDYINHTGMMGLRLSW
jgi:outer membrane autotransporter protein